MKIKNSGFTLVELLTVIAIIGVLAALLLPTIRDSQIAAKRARIKTVIAELDRACTVYKGSLGEYPNDDENNGNANDNVAGWSGGAIPYVNDQLARYLDGDTVNKGPSGKPFYNFSPNQLSKEASPDIPPKIIDEFEEPIWFHCFEDDREGSPLGPLTGKNLNKDGSNRPLHPAATIWKFTEVQIFTKANFGDPADIDTADNGMPYDGNPPAEDTFRWITNYHD